MTVTDLSESTDEIRLAAHLDAEFERAWQIFADATEFGRWFGMALTGPFINGQDSRGSLVPTEANSEVAAQQRPFAGRPVHLLDVEIVVNQSVSFGWHPFALDPGIDYSGEPPTRVQFHLTARDKGVDLIVSETGFDALPQGRRDEAFRAHQGGWRMQIDLIQAWLSAI